MARMLKVLSLLEEADRAAYEEFLRGPATTIDDGVAWLAEHGYPVSRKAVWSHKKNFQEVLDGVRRSAETARAFAQVAREGKADLSEAALARFNQLLCEKLFSMENDAGIEASELESLAKALRGGVASLGQIEQIKADFAKRQAEAVKAAEGAVKTGASGQAVVNAFKRAMGITTENTEATTANNPPKGGTPNSVHSVNSVVNDGGAA